MRKKFLKDQNGAIAIMLALTAPVLLLTVAGTLELVSVQSLKTELQAAADAGAVAGAKQLTLADASRSTVEASIRNSVHANIRGTVTNPVIIPLVAANGGEVTVKITADFKTKIAGKFGLGMNKVSAQATANVLGDTNVCVLALEPSKAASLSLEKSAQMTGRNCSVFVNSASSNSIMIKGNVELTADMVCTAGGVKDKNNSIDPEPTLDCPTFQDPLADRVYPAVEACRETNYVIDSGDVILQPGTYCGGIHIKNDAKVRFDAGVYVMKDGALLVEDTAQISGIGVGFFLTGDKAFFRFNDDTDIHLEAPTSGVMAGLLFFGAREQKKTLRNHIYSNKARILLGTIYLPANILRVDSDGPVADQSAYTAVVANQVRLYGGPHLVLNTDYNATTVPMPDSIQAIGKTIRLVR